MWCLPEFTGMETKEAQWLAQGHMCSASGNPYYDSRPNVVFIIKFCL